jgi:hypothetical protein
MVAFFDRFDKPTNSRFATMSELARAWFFHKLTPIRSDHLLGIFQRFVVMQTHLSQDFRRTEESSEAHRSTIAVLLMVLTLALRFAPLPENFSAFGALAIFCGLYTSGAFRWWFPIAALLTADCIGQLAGIPGMGFYRIESMLLNYAGFLAMIFVSSKFRSRSLMSSRFVGTSFGAIALCALVSSACFFLISNFGAWLDPLMQYPRTASGLMNCYLAGLPFWRSTLTSDLVFTIGFSLFATLMSPVVGRLAFSRR